MKTRILLADDHQIVRDGLRLILRSLPSCEVVGEAADGHEAVAQITGLMPDIAIVDLHMPGLDGLELLQCLRDQCHRSKVIVLSGDADEDVIQRALELGVAAYVIKANAGAELLRAIEAVAAGKAFFSPEVASAVAEGYRRAVRKSKEAPDSALSEREQQILVLIADGQSTKEIGFGLGLSPKTVETHRLRIMEKLGLHSVAALTKYAIREGLTKL